ncbi:MAG: hypothetical protein COV33_01000 [Candidatus Zambryskibacteria bacterium CG10_big_fil_rev_8_21_14_0_10_34_34]|uniref:Uncharacterized protein n=1 Tax=Candidatus Zambryskibacteria bacterium CG10_big_fil_rev_8_21_14_0_10_34_34 TaxID=1975114 RepID=A0A2H0R2G3_9BACT|nr:MAG: hypothetical protein COV33_01000 [Candidatus Zambryskibacteria bacterium CG10_big_fil_rev_8_21_14_0_10_34_34]
MPYAITIPEELEERIRTGKIPETELVRALEQYVSNHPSLAGVIDSERADNGERKTQQEWISFFNEQGKAMISAPDVYRAAKIGSDELVRKLKEDFSQSRPSNKYDTRIGLVTSTRIVYNAHNQEATITHNTGSSIVEPQEYKVMIPHYFHKREYEVLRSEGGLAFLRALFDTNDRPGVIEEVLIRLSGKSREMFAGYPVCEGTKIWTPKVDGEWLSQSREIVNAGKKVGRNYQAPVEFKYRTDHHLGFRYYGDLEIFAYYGIGSYWEPNGFSRGVVYPELKLDKSVHTSKTLSKVKRFFSGS